MANPEFDVLHTAILLATGFVAGWINVLAGGGSNLTLPALMIMGMPADVANATNRVAVLLQSLVGLAGFRGRGRLPTDDLGPILVPTIVGGAVGAAVVTQAPEGLLKPLLLIAMVGMTLVILLKPQVVAPPPGTPVLCVRDAPSARVWLFLAGFYGGFVQAGVGFILIAALAGSLRYDLVATNALKLASVSVFTLVSLAIFLADDLVRWQPGLVLSAGTMLGANLGVRFAVRAKPQTLKRFLFAMTLCGAALALLSDR